MFLVFYEAASPFEPKTKVGCAPSVIVSFVIMHFFTSSRDGISYIMSVIIPSKMLRSPLAPVFLSSVFCATALTASGSIFSSTPSILNNF